MICNANYFALAFGCDCEKDGDEGGMERVAKLRHTSCYGSCM